MWVLGKEDLCCLTIMPVVGRLPQGGRLTIRGASTRPAPFGGLRVIKRSGVGVMAEA